MSRVALKFYIFGLFFIFSLSFNAQKYYTKNGVTEFDGSKAAFEPIKAKNSSSISVIDISNGNIAALIKIKDFEFRLGLMQEHFNENYLESYKYPKSTFDGYIEKFDSSLINSEYINIKVKGKLTIKGTENEIIADGKIRKIEDIFNLIASFPIKLSDFNVKIPKVVFMKIDEVVKINLNYNYALQN